MNPYHLDLSDSNLRGPFASLEVLYEGMPLTNGCDKCSDVYEVKDWCCLRQSPSMYYVEFLYAFIYIKEKWCREDKQDILLRSIRNYLDNDLNKGCSAYYNGCEIYDRRCLACRLYGVIPKESWDKRWQVLRNRQGDDFKALRQCDIISSEKEITPECEDKWFNHTSGCEERIGVSSSRIALHDDAGGSYRTFHDHLLLEMLGASVMGILTNVRLTNPSGDEIDVTLREMRRLLGQLLRGLKPPWSLIRSNSNQCENYRV